MHLLTSEHILARFVLTIIDFPSPIFWLEKENLILSNVLIRGESKCDDKSGQNVFKWSEVHLSEVTSYKIHTLVINNRNASSHDILDTI